MAKEVVEKKGGFSAEAQILAKHFYDTTKLKCTKAEFMRGVGNLKALLLAGYTNQEIKDSIDWCIENKHDVYSLGYIARCINDILLKVKVIQTNKELKEYSENKLKEKSIVVEQSNTQEFSNADKFKQMKRKGVKGI